MARICSAHQGEEVEGCELCHTEVWQLLGVSQAEFEASLAGASSEGTCVCPHCGFEQLRATTRDEDGLYGCRLCGRAYPDPSEGGSKRVCG